ncbi:hypothetical protein V5F59_13110 [Xanthobacter autotrophicus DSM 431]|uniref:hypothetical protein n=1 Tax=Xanthobacter nonsaccharivorans TaxID=3119912 RepID=UPI00372B2703
MDGRTAGEGISPAAFSQDMDLAARAEARLMACADAIGRTDLQLLLAFVMGVEAALLLLRAVAEDDMAAADAAREARRLPLTLDSACFARMPQAVRLEVVALKLCADRLGSRFEALAGMQPRQSEKPRRRQTRPRLHVMPGPL